MYLKVTLSALLGVLSCWSVTYIPDSMCALKGSSVELHSYYTYPEDHTVTKTFWFTTWPRDQEPEDLMQIERYQRRLYYTDHTKNNHTLFIRNLTATDSDLYRFRFVTDKKYGTFAGGSVELLVTELQLLLDPATVKEGDNVTLTCSTTCSLTNNPTYIWYRNSQPVHDLADNRLAIDSARPEDAGKYSCAVKGHEALGSPERTINIRYGPRNTTALVHPFGDPINLTCSSDANPPVQIYMWYQKTGSESFQVGLGQTFSIPRINAGQTEYYYCVAENEIGQNKSSVVQIEQYVVYELPNANLFWILVAGGVIAALFGAAVYKGVTKAREVKDISTGVETGTTADTYTGLNLKTMTSSEYETLEDMKISTEHARNIYSNPASVQENIEKTK